MTKYISEMSRNVIVTFKRCGKTWSEIQSYLKNKYSTTYLNVACKKFDRYLQKQRKRKAWFALEDRKNYQ